MWVGNVFRSIGFAVLVAGAVLTPRSEVRAQSPDTLSPEESTSRAKQIIEQAIQALGGPAYLGLRDTTCTFRAAQFGHNQEVTGYQKILDYNKLPDKDRQENAGKRNLISVSTATAGWELDRGGVQDAKPDDVARYVEELKKDVDYLLRYRLNEEGLIFRWDGLEVLDLHEVDWVEVVDSERRTVRIAFERRTHLPVRAIYLTRDRVTRERNEELEYRSNYHPIEGIQTPFQIARERNGLKYFQVFLEDCKYNTGLDDSLFTRASLEKRFAELTKGKKPK